ncbi:hypothetical protein H4R19_003463, partial [Coemansia spiralis]
PLGRAPQQDLPRVRQRGTDPGAARPHHQAIRGRAQRWGALWRLCHPRRHRQGDPRGQGLPRL